MEKKTFKKMESAFKYEDLEMKLSGLTAFAGYSYTKRNNPTEYNNLLSLLPVGYVTDLKDNLESIDLIYSGSTASPFLLTIAAGRNDVYKGKECYDIDVFNIAPDTTGTASYFQQQWHHFKNEDGNRTSYEIHPIVLTDEEKRKDILYGSFLTGSTTYYTIEEYEAYKADFFAIHQKSFGNLGI